MIGQICFDTALMEAAKEVFETMVFVNIGRTDPPVADIGAESLLSTITFKGNIEGCLGVCCNKDCAKIIALNMLGMDPSEEIGVGEICDAMGEISNMVMGSVKSRVQNIITNIEVSIPSVVSGRELQNNLGDRSHKYLLKLNIEEKYVAELSLVFREKIK
jgi:chemotaxis protein CheX